MNKQIIRKRIIKYLDIWIIVVLAVLMIGGAIPYFVLNSYIPVEQLEYQDVDFEWVDDFQNYVVKFNYENKTKYLTTYEHKIKFVFAGDDFLNFVVIDHSRRVYDHDDKFSVNKFYINLNYKEMKYE